jgi:hypothetical integral membrane protein (TIGR02206 family)
VQWFGLSHLIGLAGIALSCLIVARLGRSHPRWCPRLDRFLRAQLITYIVIAYAWRWTSLSLATCLPLHLCDFILIGAVYLLSRKHSQLVFECIYLWSWSGSIWALITPDLSHDFPHYRYFEFFWGHGLIFVVLAHLESGQGYRLHADSWKRAAWGLLLWTLSVGALDLTFGWNYGYLLCKPPGGSPLDYFGPWPLYIAVANLLALLIFRLICRVRVPTAASSGSNPRASARSTPRC